MYNVLSYFPLEITNGEFVCGKLKFIYSNVKMYVTLCFL